MSLRSDSLFLPVLNPDAKNTRTLHHHKISSGHSTILAITLLLLSPRPSYFDACYNGNVIVTEYRTEPPESHTPFTQSPLLWLCSYFVLLEKYQNRLRHCHSLCPLDLLSHLNGNTPDSAQHVLSGKDHNLMLVLSGAHAKTQIR